MYLKMPMVFTLCTVLFCVCDISGNKILGIFPFFSPSHFFLGNELMKGLAEAGHEVTMMTVFEEKNPPKNGKYKQIIMDDLIKEQKAMFSYMTNLSSHSTQNWFDNPFVMINAFRHIGNKISEMYLKNERTQQLIKSKEHFDVVIVPQFAMEAIKALAPHLGAHLVLLNNNAMNSWMGHFVGYPTLPSIDADILLGYTEPMNFQQRLLNSLLKLTSNFLNNFFAYPDQNKLVHQYISKDIDLTKTQYNISLVLSNSHSSFNKAQGSMPVIKDIGGFHVRPPKKLPDDLKKYLDEAKNGVVYFSMGSNLKGADIPVETRKAILRAFSRRKENILWKFESNDLPGKPDNVRIEKWLPQNDILAHPNVKLFITHGGFLSTIETIYHGVPTIAIPIFGDQLKNAKTAEADGYTLILDFKSLNEEKVYSAIEEVLSNKKYLNNAESRSRIFHDRKIKPLDEAVYWVEYIVRHNGAPHLRVDYLNMSWYQYYLVDVFAFIITVIVLFLIIVKKIVCCILAVFKSKGDKKSKKVKNQ